MLEAPLPNKVTRSNRSRFDTIVDISAAVGVLLAGASLVWSISEGSTRATPGYKIGETFSSGDTVQFDGAPVTLVIWLQSQCGACQDSVDFYRRLTAHSRARVIVMSPEPADRLQKFLDAASIRPKQAVSTNGQWNRFKVTPTLLLVGSDSAVRKVWDGRIRRASDEEAIIRLIE